MAKANAERSRRLRAWVQNYDWGRYGAEAQVARLLALNCGIEFEPERPYAEFWMGTHGSGPSFLADEGEEEQNVGLRQWIERNPNVLGHKVLENWGSDLPFLFKVCSFMFLTWICRKLNFDLSPSFCLLSSDFVG